MVSGLEAGYAYVGVGSSHFYKENIYNNIFVCKYHGLKRIQMGC